MKSCRFLVIKLVSAFILLGSSQQISAAPLVRLTSGEWPPYLSQTLPHHGFAAHLVTQAFQEVGIDVELGHYPWKRSYKYALDGIDQSGKKWNGTILWARTPEREQTFYYSDVVVIDEEVLFHLKKFPMNWKTVEDLKGKTLGGTAHTIYPEFEAAAEKGWLTLQRGGNYDSLLKRIFHQKIDAAPIIRYVGLYYLNHTFTPDEQKKFTYAPQVIETRRYHLILSKQNPENERYIELFNQGLKKLRENGRYDQMFNDLKQGAYNLSTQ